MKTKSKNIIVGLSSFLLISTLISLNQCGMSPTKTVVNKENTHTIIPVTKTDSIGTLTAKN